MKNKKKTYLRNNQSGFTLLEIILAMVIGMFIFGIAAETIFQQASTYFFISSRKSTMADVRHTLNSMSSDLMKLNSNSITSVSATSIHFIDSNGNNASYSLNTNGGTLAVYKGNNDVILPNVSGFAIEYQDGLGNEVDPDDENISDIVRIKITITTESDANEGDISISTTVIPRDFIGYTNFQ